MRKLGSIVVRSVVWLGLAFLCLAGVMLGCGQQPGQREFDAGVRELADGQYARAKVLFEKSMTKRPASPENAWAHNYIGVADVRLGHLDEAIQQFEESRRLYPEAVEPYCNLGTLMEESGYTVEAEAFYQAAVNGRPDGTRAHEVLADFYRRQGQADNAQRVLHEAMERSPNEPAVLTALAVTEFASEGAGHSEALLMKALESDRHYAPALFNLGLLYEKQFGFPEKAAPLYEHYLEVAPDGPHAEYAHAAYGVLEVPEAQAHSSGSMVDPLPEAGPAVASFRNLLSAAADAAKKGDGAKAMQKALDAASLAEGQGDIKGMEAALKVATVYGKDRPESHFARGQFMEQRGRYEEALYAYKRSLMINPEQPAALVGLAESAIETGEMDAALVALKRAIRMAPEEPEALWDLAFLYDEHLALKDQAAKAYRDFARLFPGDPRIIRANKRLSALEVPEVVEQAAPAPKKEPTPKEKVAAAQEEVAPPVTPPAPPPKPDEKKPRKDTPTAVKSFNRGTVYQRQGNWARAIYYYRQSLQHDPDFLNAFYNLGIAYAATGNYDLAAKAYDRSLELDPGMDHARYNLALVYLEMKMGEKAEKTLVELVRRSPGYAAAHYALGLLYSKEPSTQRKAREHYEEFLKLSPTDDAAQAVKEWLDQPRG